MFMRNLPRFFARNRLQLSLIVLAVAPLSASTSEAATSIRISQAHGGVSTCATPNRLMAFLRKHNRALPARFADIAWHYKRHGEKWRVRWDYAFFQMAVETNFLNFRRANGQPGDVNIRQNNFAGLGATGGGVAGDSYPDVSTGVLAQIQHLVVYSGERIARPVGHRTRLKQGVILRATARIAGRRPVTFQDLAGRWASDRAYGRTIDAIAQRFYRSYCGKRNGVQVAGARHVPRPRRAAVRKYVRTAIPAPTRVRRNSARQSEAIRSPIASPAIKQRRATILLGTQKAEIGEAYLSRAPVSNAPKSFPSSKTLGDKIPATGRVVTAQPSGAPGDHNVPATNRIASNTNEGRSDTRGVRDTQLNGQVATIQETVTVINPLQSVAKPSAPANTGNGRIAQSDAAGRWAVPALNLGNRQTR